MLLGDISTCIHISSQRQLPTISSFIAAALVLSAHEKAVGLCLSDHDHVSMVICMPLFGELERSGLETSLTNMEQLQKNPCFSLKISDKSFCSPSSYSSIIQRQNLVCFLRNPHYGSLIYADGHGEVWTDWNNMSKFFQYGWRCSTNENSYSNSTLIGNWNQERYDLKNIVKPKPLPSQFGHYFESTYDTSYNSKKPRSAHRFKREAHWFPGHQPELDPPHYKCTEKSTYMNTYSKPQPSHYFWCLCDPNVEQTSDQGV